MLWREERGERREEKGERREELVRESVNVKLSY